MKQESWQAAIQAFSLESDALLVALDHIDQENFGRAVQLLANAERIACSGSGHSGIACMHFAHSLCCIDRPARFLSPSEAIHGAAGFLHSGDILVIASRGGKTQELIPVLEIAAKKEAKIIVITENLNSALAEGADVVLKMTVTRECDKYNCQGTTSFIVLSGIFDALQTALIEEIDYSNKNFAVVHPGGAVGERLNKNADGKKDL